MHSWRPQSSDVSRDAEPRLVHQAPQPRLVLRRHPALPLAPAPHLRRRTGALRVSALRARRSEKVTYLHISHFL